MSATIENDLNYSGSSMDRAQQQKKYIKTSYREFKLEFGIKIKEASFKNLNRLKESLGGLSSEEMLLQEIIAGNLTARHKTNYWEEIQTVGSLLSVREREERTQKNAVSHTNRMAGTNNIFFTIGLGEHKTPSFLDDIEGGHVIELKLKSLFENANASISGMFVSGHLSDYRQETTTRPVYMGDTFFRFTHDDLRKEKIYTYRPNGGGKIVRTVSMAEEVFCGKDILDGLALTFIQHLRFIGGSYQKYIFEIITNLEVSPEEKIRILSVAMHYIMPGWIYPEGKLPGELPLAIENGFIQNSHILVKDYSKEKKTFDRWEDYCGGWFDRFIMRPARYTYISIEEKKELLNGDIEELTRLKEYNGGLAEPLAYAAIENNLEMVKILLELKTPDSRDPMVMRMADPNGGWYPDFSKYTLIERLCIKGNYEVLETLIQAGAKATGKHAPFLLHLTASDTDNDDVEVLANRKKCFKILLENGADFEEEHLNKTPLINFVTRGDLESIILCIKYNADVNRRFQKFYVSSFAGSGNLASKKNGYTALHFLMISRNEIYQSEAGKKLRLDIATYLIEKGADPSIKADNGATVLSLAKEQGHNDIIALLTKLGINSDTSGSSHETCQEYVRAVVSIVIGKDADGRDVIIAGKKKDSDGSIRQRYLAPGGFVDRRDKTVIAAALRELQEETYIDLKHEVATGQVEASVLYTYAGIDVTLSGKRTHHTISYVVVNVGESLAGKKFGSRDDLHGVRTIPLSQIQADESKPINRQCFFVEEDGQEIPIIASNALIFMQLRQSEHTLSLSSEMQSHLAELSSLEISGHQQLVAAAKEGNLERVTYLVETFGLSVEHEKDYPQALHEAARSGHLAVVKILIKNGASVSAQSYTVSSDKLPTFKHFSALSAAALGGNVEVFQYLYNQLNNMQLIDVNSILVNALSAAAYAGHVNIARFILAETAIKIDARDSNGWSRYPLTLAASQGKKDMVCFLINNGADVNAACSYDPRTASLRDYVQPSPIVAAIECGHSDIAQSLMRLPQTDINRHWVTQNQKFETIASPLFAAIDKENEELVQWILDKTEINLDTKNDKGQVALEFAMHIGQYKTALKIIEKMILSKIAKNLWVHISELGSEIGLDENNKPTVHILVKNMEIAKKVEGQYRATLKESKALDCYVLRFGKCRLSKAMGEKIGEKLYTLIVHIYVQDPSIVVESRMLQSVNGKESKSIGAASIIIPPMGSSSQGDICSDSSFFNCCLEAPPQKKQKASDSVPEQSMEVAGAQCEKETVAARTVTPLSTELQPPNLWSLPVVSSVFFTRRPPSEQTSDINQKESSCTLS